MRTLALSLLVLSLGACASTIDKLNSIGDAPDLSAIENPAAIYGHQPVIMPTPYNAQPATRAQAQASAYAVNSLWADNARAFFKDQRAATVGDILTVRIDVADRASVSNSTQRSRSSSEDSGISDFLGLEELPGAILPGGFNPASLASADSSSASAGSGTVDRSERIALTAAAIVTQVLPNGNLVIAGRQEMRINHEVRELLITGIIRPEDIAADNTIRHTQIAEARISYGGRGLISDVQQPRYGQQFMDIILPF